MAETLINDVSDTALWVAHYRAVETERPDALFRDPLASRLVGEKGRKIAASMSGSQMTAWSVVMRTCIIDAYIRELVGTGVDAVVNLGAGLDTRPYRLDLPASLRWIEVDYPHIIALKDERLRDETPRCQLERVALDLSDRPARQQLFARLALPSHRVLVLTEGVVPYLSNEQVAELADDLRAQSAFCFWILDYFAPELLRYMGRKRRKQQMKNAPFLFAPPEWFEFFKGHGWRAKEIRYHADEADKVGRRPPLPWWIRVLSALAPRPKASPHRKFSGYVLLEPG